MKRLLLVLSAAAITACNPLTIEDFRRPFACDHTRGDGGQCAKGWACGFDDRCFDNKLDGGQRVAEWRCDGDRHCPTDWSCGQEVNATRFCRELGVGAPWACLTTDGGCEGGWRCGAEQRCFDPFIPDGGTARECTLADQCPNGFACGEFVKDRGQHCIDDLVPAASDCKTDRGCRGAHRCDTFENRCVLVTDVITTGQTSTLTAAELSPRRHEPVPLAFAMSRTMALFPIVNVTQSVREGVLMASVLSDGGLRVAAQFRDEVRSTDGGATRILHEQTWNLPGPASELSDLAISAEGPAVRFRDGTGFRLSLPDAGGWQPLGPIDFLRQRDPFDPQQRSQLVRVSGNDVTIDGIGTAAFPSRVHEVLGARDGLYVFTDAGAFFANDAGVVTSLPGPTFSLPTRSRGAVAGYVGPPMNPSLAVFAEVPRAGGSTGVVAITDAWSVSPTFSACPDGGSPLQLAMDVDDQNKELLVARCGTSASSFPVQAIFKGNSTEYRGLVESQIPFQWGLVTQRAGPFVRAHAGADGRVWHATDTTGRSLLGKLPLRPVLLDRQPQTLISFREQGTNAIRVFAQSGGNIFISDPGGGFVSELVAPTVAPLSVITSRSWLVATSGLLDAEGGQPRLLATLPNGESFTPPATGVVVQVQLGAQLRDVVLVSSGDSIWLADVTEAKTGIFAQPAVFSRVLVPFAGVALRSMTAASTDGGTIAGYLTIGTQNLIFGTTDLTRWSLSPVAAPVQELLPLPLEVWTESAGGKGRTGFSDGQVWSLPIMVPLTQPLRSRDGGSLVVDDYGRKCADLFAVSTEGLFRAEAGSVDGGLPGWVPVSLPITPDSTDSLRLYETRDDVDRLFIGTKSGQVIEVIGACR